MMQTMATRVRSIEVPAFIEVHRDEAQEEARLGATFARTSDVLASPALQKRIVNKRAFTALLRKMKRVGVIQTF